MAIYEYVCPKCGKEFELMRPMSQSDAPAKCLQCGAIANRLVSSFGSKVGFYVKSPEKPPFRKPRARTKRPTKKK